VINFHREIKESLLEMVQHKIEGPREISLMESQLQY